MPPVGIAGRSGISEEGKLMTDFSELTKMAWSAVILTAVLSAFVHWLYKWADD